MQFLKPLLLAVLVGCAPQAMTTNARHPANPDAPTGRLAGPPVALRPGVADISTPPRGTTTPAAPTDHSNHGKPVEAEATETEPAKAAPPPQKPARTKSTEKPRKPDKAPASKKAPGTETPKPTPPPAHQGHEGHH